METERQQWMGEIVQYTVARPGSTSYDAIRDFRNDTVTAFSRFWHAMSRHGQRRFEAEAGRKVHSARLAQERGVTR